MEAKHMGTIGNPFSIDQKNQKKGPKILAGLRSARSANGGFHFRHEFTGFEHEPEDHEKATGHEAVQHFIKHMGICPMPAIPDVPPAQVHPVITGNDRLQNVPPGDTMPVGSIIPAPDGSRWEKMASQTPFGVATYYAKIA